MLKSLRTYLRTSPGVGIHPAAIFLSVIFVALRLTTSGIAFAPLPLIGLVLLFFIIKEDRVWGFVFTLFDVCILGGQVALTSWQLGSIARFGDLEFVLLMVLGISRFRFNFKGRYFNILSKPIKILFVLLLVSLAYSAARFGIFDALRVARTVFYNSLLFVVPYYLRNLDDLKRALRYVFVILAFTTFVDFGGYLLGDPSIMTPFNQDLDKSAMVWQEASRNFAQFRIYTGISYEGYDKPLSFIAILLFGSLVALGIRRPKFVTLVFVLAITLEVFAMSRSYVGGIVIAFGSAIVLTTIKEKKALPRLLLTVLPVLFGFVLVATLWYPSMLGTIGHRFYDIYLDLSGSKEGTVSSRIGYFTAATSLMGQFGGDIIRGIGFGLIPAQYGVIFDIGQFTLRQFQSSGQSIQTTSMDSGWANVFFTMGIVGVIFFIWLIVYYLKQAYKLFFSTADPMASALSLTLLVFFIDFPFMFFGLDLIYGKSIFSMVQFMLLISITGLWLDYSEPARPRTMGTKLG